MNSRVPKFRGEAACVLIMLRHGMIARNLFRTAFLTGLLEGGARLVVACPAADDPLLKRELEAQGVVLVELPLLKKGLFERLWDAVTSALVFDHPGATRTMYIKWLHFGLVEKQWTTFIRQGLAAPFFLHKVKPFRRWVAWVDSRLFSHPEIGQLFDTHGPDLFVATNVFEPDVHYIREARRRGIATVGIVKSWDNLSSKTKIAVEPDRLLVWSPEMRDEAVHLHFIPEERISIVGTPQFDVYVNYQGYQSREDFCQRIGADPDKKLIVYSTADSWTTDEENLRLIHRIVNQEDFCIPCHIHVRKYPKSQRDLSAIEAELGITAENAGRVVPSWADRVDQSREEMEHLCELMYHADLVIHLGSTIALDAACHDTPNIGFGLDSRSRTLPWAHYGRRIFRSEHNRRLIEPGGVKMVVTPEELKAAMQHYLLHPEADRAGREAVLERIIWKRDGRSGQRAADQILKMLEERVTPVVSQRTQISVQPRP